MKASEDTANTAQAILRAASFKARLCLRLSRRLAKNTASETNKAILSSRPTMMMPV